jgi:hypothetical protein
LPLLPLPCFSPLLRYPVLKMMMINEQIFLKVWF